MTFSIRHPSEPRLCALYGFDPDPRRLFWAEVHEAPASWEVYNPLDGGFLEIVEEGSVKDTFCALDERFDTARPMESLLRFLAQRGFFDLVEVCEAVTVVQTQGLDRLPQKFKRIGEVLKNLDAGLA